MKIEDLKVGAVYKKSRGGVMRLYRFDGIVGGVLRFTDLIEDVGKSIYDFSPGKGWLQLEREITVHELVLLRKCSRLVAENYTLAGECHALRLENADLRERFRETMNNEYGEQMAAMAANVEKLEAENARLRAALKPLADAE